MDAMSAPIERLPQVVDMLKKMGAHTVILFGSAVSRPHEARDLDLAVAGIPLSKILEADVVVHDILQYPTDLISQEENPSFFNLVKSYGKSLYEQA